MFVTTEIGDKPDAIAPDGSEVRRLCRTNNGSMGHFRLAPATITRAVVHRTIDEFWHILSGEGRIWMRLEGTEEIADLRPGLSISLPVGTRFQFRCDGHQPLEIVSVATPPWPGDDEAIGVEGPWTPTV